MTDDLIKAIQKNDHDQIKNLLDNDLKYRNYFLNDDYGIIFYAVENVDTFELLFKHNIYNYVAKNPSIIKSIFIEIISTSYQSSDLLKIVQLILDHPDVDLLYD